MSLPTKIKGSEWRLLSAPGAAVQATATHAAATGLRHVLTSMSFFIAIAGTAPGSLDVIVRDGATGVGAILWQGQIQTATNNSAQVIVNFNDEDGIIGTAGNQMTVEFAAGPGTSNFERLNATGYLAA